MKRCLPGLTIPIAWNQLVAIFVAVVILSLVGCHRAFYRLQADRDVACLVRERSHNPDCDLPGFTIQVDPQSRMYDPFCPDHPPMPPDDPEAHRLMHCVDCKEGYPCWHANGDTRFVESPRWSEYLPLDENGVLSLDADLSVRLALVNSTNYQREFETLYLSALDVTAERFAFDKQVFAGYGSQYTADGGLRNGTANSSSELALETRGIRFEKMSTTGAELVVGLANSIIWEFSGPDTNATSTLLDFTLLQPLLRRAGRDRIMETLTLSERTLLANVRALERFRRGFYLEIVTGRGRERGPTRRGGFFGTSGLTGFTGVGGGGFGGVGTSNFSVPRGAQGAGAAQAGGFMGLLQAQQDIRNQEANIAGLRSSLAQLEESLNESLRKIPDRPDDILRQRLQIAQARQALLNAQSRLLNSQNFYQSALDEFKIDMGLPPHVCVKVEDPMLDKFNLIDVEILPRQTAIAELQRQVGSTTGSLLDAFLPGKMHEADPSDDRHDAAPLVEQLLGFIEQIEPLCQELADVNVERARQDIDRLAESLPQRREELERLRMTYQTQLDEPCAMNSVDCQVQLPADAYSAVFDTARFDKLPESLEEEVDRIAKALNDYGPQLHQLREALVEFVSRLKADSGNVIPGSMPDVATFAMPALLAELADDVLDLSLIQARARTESIRLVQVDVEAAEALQIARRCRRDWKNARAALVDAWRLIEFNADELESRLDVVWSGDLSTTGDNPVKFRTPTGRMRVGLEFDAPLTRLLERNNYRQSLIEYQQAKRSFYRFEDRVSQSLRAKIRTMKLNQLNFEQQRLAVLGAIDQVVLNDEILSLTEQRGETSGATAARDVVSALADLQDAQNNFLSVWVNYEVLRRSLDLDLGTMRLDADGTWIDPGPMGGKRGLPFCHDCRPHGSVVSDKNPLAGRLQLRR